MIRTMLFLFLTGAILTGHIAVVQTVYLRGDDIINGYKVVWVSKP